MTASVYGVIAYTDLNTFMGLTLASVDALFTQAVVESWISQAERAVYAIKHEVPLSTDPFDVMAVTLLSERIAYDTMMKRNTAGVEIPKGNFTDSLTDVLKLWDIAHKTQNNEIAAEKIHIMDVDY